MFTFLYSLHFVNIPQLCTGQTENYCVLAESQCLFFVCLSRGNSRRNSPQYLLRVKSAVLCTKTICQQRSLRSPAVDHVLHEINCVEWLPVYKASCTALSIFSALQVLKKTSGRDWYSSSFLACLLLISSSWSGFAFIWQGSCSRILLLFSFISSRLLAWWISWRKHVHTLKFVYM